MNRKKLSRVTKLHSSSAALAQSTQSDEDFVQQLHDLPKSKLKVVRDADQMEVETAYKRLAATAVTMKSDAIAADGEVLAGQVAATRRYVRIGRLLNDAEADFDLCKSAGKFANSKKTFTYNTWCLDVVGIGTHQCQNYRRLANEWDRIQKKVANKLDKTGFTEVGGEWFGPIFTMLDLVKDVKHAAKLQKLRAERAASEAGQQQTAARVAEHVQDALKTVPVATLKAAFSNSHSVDVNELTPDIIPATVTKGATISDLHHNREVAEAAVAAYSKTLKRMTLTAAQRTDESAKLVHLKQGIEKLIEVQFLCYETVR